MKTLGNILWLVLEGYCFLYYGELQVQSVVALLLPFQLEYSASNLLHSFSGPLVEM